MDGLTEFAPLAAAIFLGLCLVWLLWRGARRLVSGTRPERREPAFAPSEEPAPVRRDPPLTATQIAAPVVPDAADILALKASIDALAKQIGALERRLAPANTNVPAPEQAAAAPAKPSLVDVLTEVPLVVPERRR